MPYSGQDDPNLPSNVKDLPAKKRRQWVDIWNSVYSGCIKDGGSTSTCETSAFKQANGVIKKEQLKGDNLMPGLSLKKLINSLFGRQDHSIKSVSTWDGSATRWDTAEAYCSDCLIDVNTGAAVDKIKGLCKLPIREPGDPKGTYVDKAVHAAAGAHGIQGVVKPAGVDSAKWDAAVKSAANELIKAYNEMGEVAPDAIYKLAGKNPPTNRSTSIGSIFEQIWTLASEKDSMAWVNDLVVEDDGSIAAIISSGGKLYKATVTLTAGSPSLGDWTEVKIDYPPVTQSRTTIYHMTGGQVRWLSVSSSAVLNRSGQIDSKKLFDSFVEHIDKTGEYPVRRFCHLTSDEFITGKCDFVARDENLLITSGIYNDTELAKKEIADREADPDYWGESIGFQSEQAQMVELAEGISIPVFDTGVLLEISAAPEKYAAAWFTNTTQITKEVENMLEARAKEALVKLFEGDEAAADKWLAENVDEKNRMIASSGMITRTTEEVPPPAPVAPITEPAAPPPTEPPTERTIELDDAAIDAIAAKVIERQAGSTDELTALKDKVANLETRVKTLEDIQAQPDNPPAKPAPAAQMVEDRLAAIEKRLEEEKKKAWYEDLPIKSTLRVTHRPRDDAKEDEVAPEKPETMADVAEATLQSMDLKY